MTWVDVGLAPDDFWRQTPRVVGLAIQGRVRAFEREQQGRAWLAWHTAALPNMKRFPRLTDLLGPAKPSPRRRRVRPLRSDHLLSVVRMWAAETGTTVEG